MLKLLIFPLILCQIALADKAFDVATVKLADPDARGYTIGGGPTNHGGSANPNRIEYVNHSLQQLVLIAYGVFPFELSAPSWMENAKFDVAAKLPEGTIDAEIPAMLRALLAERFHLTAHLEPKDQTVYSLSVAKGGAKLKPSTAPEPPPPGIPMKSDADGVPLPVADRVVRYSVGGRLQVSAGHQDSGQIARMLSKFMSAVVVDKTGLTGKFDFTLGFADDDSAEVGVGVPSLSTALQEQVGLHLDKAKEPVNVLVIDHADRVPSDN